MKEELQKAIEESAKKAKEAENPDAALKFSQAALNAAHALSIISNLN